MSNVSVEEERSRPTYKVETVTGQEITLQHRLEKRLYEAAQVKYLSEYEFPMANDLRTLERLLLIEVSLYRCQWQLAAGADYDGVNLEASEEAALRKAEKEYGTQLVDLQRDLGVTKAQRDRAGHDSVGAYITQLKQAAKLHGVKREKELGKAIELTKELFALCGAFSRSSEEERRKLGFDGPEDIIEWVLTYMKPEFDAIDEHFRQNEQRFWVRKL